MIRNKLLKGFLTLVALGVVLTPAVTAYAESYGTGVTRSIESIDVDSEFMIKPEVFVNNEQIDGDDIKVLSNGVNLPLETISYKMGDILEGSNEDAYVLRKSDKLIIIMPKENSYKVNGVEHTINFTIKGDKTYAPYEFFNTVLGYDISLDGNSIKFGQNTNADNDDFAPVLDGTLLDNMMIKQEIYINGDRYPDFGVQVYNGITYLPIDVVCEKMGDRLEGDAPAEYYLRKNNMMLSINSTEGKYYLNGQENKLDMRIQNNHLYVPVSFFTNVLNYEMKENGNSVYIGKDAEKTVISNTISNGTWTSENGNWYYMNGSEKVTGWTAYDNAWYYMNNEGAMQTGWVKDNGKWYFLNEEGKMQTGWIIDNNGAYYLNKNGEMVTNTIVDGFNITENGMAISLY